ncbi:SDR family NAD(P)-dependent oxidoreductase [Spirosoma sp. KCTC 42546]|uniref:SDR family oxidoreductase n=1 Tax=Spirosoma sp. KCTC 42546 TaxID=2520506 RepID=UPI0011592360|nr:SDR family NAD(P)-dependent oxidoreductase [Spirosoma sp. KCTC 42546]QDK78526.1 SDR family NAD(P)-dependent oxidoreductase [Spirosoma sp. KCTC 42546]
MKTTQNTILITGGSAGIGFELARQFDQKGNHVIITGRSEERLQKAAAQLKNVTAIAFDVTNEADVNRLVDRLQTDFPKLNILINNAGNAFYYKLEAEANAFEKAGEEMLTNYLSVIRLTEKLVPLLSKQEESAIVNVSSIVAFAPNHKLPTYAASKAALHSYTQSLRITLERSSTTKVFELMPPLVNTDFSQAIGGENGIAPSVVADDLLSALENDNYEIHVGNTAQIYALSLSSPAGALAVMNA